MSVSALVPILAGGGTFVVLLAGAALWSSRELPPPSCDMPAPDGSRDCEGTAGHVGWHHTEQAAWYGDVWKPATERIPVTERISAAPLIPTLKASITTTMVVTAGAMALLVLIMGEMMQAAKPYDEDAYHWERAHESCAWRWYGASSSRPLCDDSPDWPSLRAEISANVQRANEQRAGKP